MNWLRALVPKNVLMTDEIVLALIKVGGRSEDFVVAHVHALADSAAHARETNAELVVELFAYGTDTTVRQVVDIVDVGTGVYKLDQIADNGNDIFLGEYLHVHRSREAQLAVDTVAANIAEVITFLRKEEICDDFTGRCIVRRLRVAQLTVDILNSLLFGVRLVFLKSIENY